MARGVASRIILGILSLLQIGLATGIIIIVAVHLYKVTVYSWADGRVLAYNTQCLMAGSVNSSDVCEYTYAVCGLSLLLSLITSILLCVTCDLCGLGPWLEFIVMGFQTAWWCIASIVLADKVKATNDAVLPNGNSIPAENWRNAVAIMSWVTFLISAIASLILLFECIKSVVECCAGRRKKNKEKKEAQQHDEQHQADGAQPVDYGAPQQQGPPQGQPAQGKDEAVRANAV